FVEPASAATYAGMKRLSQQNKLPAGNIVGILTGHGLKDGETPKIWAEAQPLELPADEILTTIQKMTKKSS
ncbi:MAG: threonine synthase, partial [Firmicutes bacterium]|nr:threonine synthase [Bacillota bacterium]